MTTDTQPDLDVIEAASDDSRGTRARAVRLLLRHPMLTAERAAAASLPFPDLVANADRLIQWFDEVTGWKLIVDDRRGFARLVKTGAFGDRRRPATSARSSRRPFTRRRYTLLCLLMATLESADRQVTLRDIAAAVAAATAALDDVDTFDPTQHDERAALVDAVLALVELGVLEEKDARDDYIDQPGTANALYHVDSRRLSALLITPRAIAAASCVAEVFHDDQYAPWDSVIAEEATEALPEWLRHSPVLPPAPARDEEDVERPTTETQRRLRVRHRLMRRLLDDPVLYYDQMTAAEREFLTSITAWAVKRLTDVGFEVERRAEGWLLVDPDSIATDVTFPAGETGGNVKQAALLLLDALVTKARATNSRTWARGEVTEMVATLLAKHPKWAAAYQGDDGRALTREVLHLLASLSLVTRDDLTVTHLAAAARYTANAKDLDLDTLWEMP
jgi:uncharacterized protein (TIGR02678 family)